MAPGSGIDGPCAEDFIFVLISGLLPFEWPLAGPPSLVSFLGIFLITAFWATRMAFDSGSMR